MTTTRTTTALTPSGFRTLPSGNTTQAYICHTAQTWSVAVHWNDTFCDAVDCYSQAESERPDHEPSSLIRTGSTLGGAGQPKRPEPDPKPDSQRHLAMDSSSLSWAK